VNVLSDRNKINLKELLQPAFLICVAVLVAASSGLAITGRTKVKKEPLPLKKSLSTIEEKSLAPYKVLNKSKIVNEDVIKALGTEEYIQWMLEDTSAEPGSSVRYSSLFITYYTGTPDAVPHIPDECYLGGGSQTRGSYEIDVPITWPSNGQVETKQNIPVRCVVFSGKSTKAWESDTLFSVMYTFKVNGAYKGSRDGVRLSLGTNRSRYSYYAKVEWQFFGVGGIDRSRIYPSREEAVKASEKLLGIVLGELERSYWPDWDQVGQLGK
jgi:hypothetical protein